MAAAKDVAFAAADGLTLYAQDHPADVDLGKLPVLCLPGLTRDSRDFEPVVPYLRRQRRVLCMDFRGRGRSGFAVDPASYRIDVEAADVSALLASLGLAKVAILGTSRGGLVGMLLAATARHQVAGLLLNDVGPVLEKEGLLRIREYLGIEPGFGSFESAAAAMKRNLPGMVGLADAQWLAFAHRIFRNDNGIPRLSYDPRLALTFPTEEQIRASTGTELWPLFDSLDSLPLAVLHGENSDLLSSETVAEMKRRMPQLQATTIMGRAHVPFLDELQSLEAISAWLDEVDSAHD